MTNDEPALSSFVYPTRRTPSMTVEEFLAPRTPEVRALAMQTRELILNSAPSVIETVHPGRNVIGYGTGATMGEMICYIAAFKSHVNLGFLHGTELPDPESLIEG